ncbi:transport and Golgi organization protein 2 homolog [Lampetra fluviatilis]
MCILFLKFDPRPTTRGAYRLIVAANRDELFSRPSLAAQFWPSHPHVISGVDLQQGKEGGSWLGVTRGGRFAALTNVLEVTRDPHARGRGELVSDYLRAETSPSAYLQGVSCHAQRYSGFNLLTATFASGGGGGDGDDGGGDGGGDELWYYSNRSNAAPISLQPGEYGLSNALLDTPWGKLRHGKAQFVRAVRSGGSPTQLTLSLLDLLNDTTPVLPDPLLEAQGDLHMKQLMPQYAAVCVRTPTYGTRTNSVLLVGVDGSVSFTERTMTEEAPEGHAARWARGDHHFLLRPQPPPTLP